MHTKGPWKYSRLKKLIRAIGGEVVAWLDLDTEECEANGNLIAAAPELLVALENMVDYYSCSECGRGTCVACRAAQDAREVIVKAKGE